MSVERASASRACEPHGVRDEGNATKRVPPAMLTSKELIGAMAFKMDVDCAITPKGGEA